VSINRTDVPMVPLDLHGLYRFCLTMDCSILLNTMDLMYLSAGEYFLSAGRGIGSSMTNLNSVSGCYDMCTCRRPVQAA